MNYSKIEILRKNKKVTIPEFAQAIGMSKNGFEKMMKQESCKVSTLEAISKYFSVPITYFFSVENNAVYAENSQMNVIEDGNLLMNPDFKYREIIAAKDETIHTQKGYIKLLTEMLGNDLLPDGTVSGRPKKTNVKGYRGLHPHKVEFMLNKILSDISTL